MKKNFTNGLQAKLSLLLCTALVFALPEMSQGATAFKTVTSEVEKLINDHIVKSDDKNKMVALIKDIRNTTYYSTNDLSRQFLEHYEKYKKLFKTVSTDYSNESSNIKELLKSYDNDVKQNYVLYKEYKRIVRIVKELEQSILVSDEETKLFHELASSISRILARKPCTKPENVKFTVSDKKCATEILKSHIDNNLVY